MKHYGICPASCGEFVQGVMDRDEYLCSYAVDIYSTAEVEEKLENINIGPSKSRKAIEMVFRKFNLPIEESKNISLKIKSDIPVGKGMASSTADIGATIAATLGLIKKELPSEEIARLASAIEPTDSIYIEKNSIFNPLNGEVIKYLGNITNSRVVILEPNKTLNTMRIKGMASSTADIGATIAATLGLIKKELPSEEIARLASAIEPTDSIYIEKNSIFNPLNGEVIKYLGNITNSRVVILEPNKTLNTMRIRKTPNYKKIKMQNKDIIKISFNLLEDGIKNNNLYDIGKACTFSSLANENIHKKEGLEKIIEISKSYGAYGVNIAHSGTVVGILIDKSMNDTRLIELLRDAKLDSFYKKIYTSNIIDVGIRGQVHGIHQKSYDDRRKKFHNDTRDNR